MVADWLQFMADFPLQQVHAGRAEYQKLIDGGHTAHWQREASAFRERQAGIEASLLR